MNNNNNKIICNNYMYNLTYNSILRLYNNYMDNNKIINRIFYEYPPPPNDICSLINKRKCGWTLVILLFNNLFSSRLFLNTYLYLNENMEKRKGLTLNFVYYLLLIINLAMKDLCCDIDCLEKVSKKIDCYIEKAFNISLMMFLK